MTPDNWLPPVCWLPFRPKRSVAESCMVSPYQPKTWEEAQSITTAMSQRSTPIPNSEQLADDRSRAFTTK